MTTYSLTHPFGDTRGGVWEIYLWWEINSIYPDSLSHKLRSLTGYTDFFKSPPRTRVLSRDGRKSVDRVGPKRYLPEGRRSGHLIPRRKGHWGGFTISGCGRGLVVSSDPVRVKRPVGPSTRGEPWFLRGKTLGRRGSFWSPTMIFIRLCRPQTTFVLTGDTNPKGVVTVPEW